MFPLLYLLSFMTLLMSTTLLIMLNSPMFPLLYLLILIALLMSTTLLIMLNSYHVPMTLLVDPHGITHEYHAPDHAE